MRKFEAPSMTGMSWLLGPEELFIKGRRNPRLGWLTQYLKATL